MKPTERGRAARAARLACLPALAALVVWGAALNCTSLGLSPLARASAAPLPAPYRAVQTLWVGAAPGVQLMVGHATLRVPGGVVGGQDTLREVTLLVARDARTNRTLWKRYVSGHARIENVAGGAVTVSAPRPGGRHFTQFRVTSGERGSVWDTVRASTTS